MNSISSSNNLQQQTTEKDIQLIKYLIVREHSGRKSPYLPSPDYTFLHFSFSCFSILYKLLKVIKVFLWEIVFWLIDCSTRLAMLVFLWFYLCERASFDVKKEMEKSLVFDGNFGRLSDFKTQSKLWSKKEVKRETFANVIIIRDSRDNELGPWKDLLIYCRLR